ncbi:hypothetical protein T492DRAFT_883603 [Pavlovales sp. CCMP2436]|nr:hypothetical protein T492DRAFT_883603 [Pavlovales sp. CCMP2436]
MHDLRSPLLSVANAVLIVQDLEPETRVDHPVVVECHRAMATLVLMQAPMRISQLLQAACDTFGGLARAKGVTLRLVPLASDLDRAVFFGDVRWLQQCVNNGVSNSVKVRAKDLFEVSDAHIPLSKCFNLGEAFTQVGLEQMQGSGGTGLGLTIARDLFRLHALRD